jgi:hypothetical protein
MAYAPGALQALWALIESHVPIGGRILDIGSQDARYRNELLAMGLHDDFFAFAPPGPLELGRLGIRTSKSFRYLGVFRAPGVHAELPQRGKVIGGLRIFQALMVETLAARACRKVG